MVVVVVDDVVVDNVDEVVASAFFDSEFFPSDDPQPASKKPIVRALIANNRPKDARLFFRLCELFCFFIPADPYEKLRTTVGAAKVTVAPPDGSLAIVNVPPTR